MHEVSTSRRAVMRALAILPAAIVTPAAAHAAVELVCAPPDNGARWASLLTNFEQAVETHSRAFDAHCESEARYYAALPGEPRKVYLRPTSTNERGEIFFDADAYNAEVKAARAEFQQAKIDAFQLSGCAETEVAQGAALDAMTEAMRAIIAFPSRDPDIIAQKLRLIIKEYGDDNGDLTPLLCSITGEAQA
ncbi:hypothetical protein BV96_01789 [Sphingomonas paucimobilis]|nr:hypothetical protein BV96_01789 [Sphingomonas paucimobilis]